MTTTTNDRGSLDLDQLRAALRDSLQRALGRDPAEIRIGYLCEPKDVADDPAKLLITDGNARELAVVLISSRIEPDLVGSGMRVAAQAKDRLGERLGSVILEPLGQGTLEGLTYTILPFREPIPEGKIRKRYWRLRLRRRVLDWLAEVTAATVKDASDADISSSFEQPLQHLASLQAIDRTLQEASREALRGLRAREWKPRFVLMHGDFWDGNVLLAPKPREASAAGVPAPFVLIDWPGAALRGYPMFDLLRIARSMRLSESATRREVSRHCDILGLDAAGARAHLLACLGHIGINLACFPIEMYTEMSNNCFIDLETALNSRGRA